EGESRPVRGGRLGAERALTCVAEILARHGFEPDREGPTELRLRNCPFHPMAEDDPALVCGVNHAFLSGMVDGLGASSVEATLAPRPGYCCVEFGPRA
ncbi:transcriptional regulator, partial [Actinomadura darangshiensis]